MNSLPNASDGGLRPEDRASLVTRVLCVLWPAFVMAGVTETLVFAMVDPRDLHWFGGAPLEASRQAVYTVAFFLFWAAIAAAAAISAQLLHAASDTSRSKPG